VLSSSGEWWTIVRCRKRGNGEAIRLVQGSAAISAEFAAQAE